LIIFNFNLNSFRQIRALLVNIDLQDEIANAQREDLEKLDAKLANTSDLNNEILHAVEKVGQDLGSDMHQLLAELNDVSLSQL
jgi:hypothetical protein